MSNSLLNWIGNWYKNNCDGDWEHSYGITIETTDNPGWHITIDLINTNLCNEFIEYSLVENNASDWYGIKVENAKFIASGDDSKLELLLLEFQKFVEARANKQINRTP